jgi:hypothetical protein
MMKTRASRLLGKLALGTAALAAALLLGEGLLRISGVRAQASFYTADPHMGWAFRPGAEGYSVREGRAFVTINHDGMRDVEHDVARPDGVVRVAVLGDSYAAAMSVPLEDSFPRLLSRGLERCEALRERRPEVLNFGVDGYGTAQELLMARHRMAKYRPDIVLLAFYAGNDLFNNVRALNPLSPDDAPYFVHRRGALTLDDAFRSQPKQAPETIERHDLWADVMNRSEVLLLVNNARTTLRPQERHTPAPEGTQAPAGPAAMLDPGHPYRMTFLPPSGPLMTEAWAVTEDLIRALRDEVQAGGARLLVVTLSMSEQVYPDAAAREALRQSLGTADLFYPDRRVVELAAREGIAALQLAPDLAAYADEHHVFLHGFPGAPRRGIGHYNQEGHRVVARRMADKVCSMLGAGPSAMKR